MPFNIPLDEQITAVLYLAEYSRSRAKTVKSTKKQKDMMRAHRMYYAIAISLMDLEQLRKEADNE